MIYSIRVKRPTVSEHREDILDYQHNLDCFFSERVQKAKTHFSSMFHFFTSLKMFSGGIEMEYWAKTVYKL